jgi:hypothetical protein
MSGAGKAKGAYVVDLGVFPSPFSSPSSPTYPPPLTAAPTTSSSNPTLSHLSLLLRSFGPFSSVQKIYLVGAHPLAVVEALKATDEEYNLPLTMEERREGRERKWDEMRTHKVLESSIWPKTVLCVLFLQLPLSID